MGILSEMDMMNRDAEDDAFEVSSGSETVDSFSEEFESVEPQKPDQQAEDEEARKKAEFDVAETKRKAEWETKQAQKKLREQQELDRLAAMSDDDVMQASMNRVSQDTERLTRRNMKLCVMEDVQTECLADPAFTRLVMNPKKKMVNCFHYINRKAREYLEQEMKDNDEKPVGGAFGGDVPDELCYDSTTHWRRGNRPRFSPYTSGYEADDTGAIYLPSLKRALQGTPWQYCALRQFYEPTKEAMQVSTYLRVYRRHPKLIEHLVKVGFERIVSDIVYRHGMGAEIDATQKRTHRILRVNKEDLVMLRELNAGVDTLKAYQQYVKLNLRGRQELLQWQLKNHVHTIPTQWFAYMTARKFMRYMDSQLPDYMQLKRAFLYRSPMEEAISTYSDYLQMCQGQNYDMKSSQVLFPKHCNEAHDELSRYIKKCRDEQTKRAFREVYENLAEKANLTSEKLQIVCPKQTDDLITEGQALHHCVGTYINRVVAKKCLIVFVRRVEEPEKPFVTVEVSNGKIVQIRGERNSDPTEEVKKFVDLWSRKVLPMALQAA